MNSYYGVLGFVFSLITVALNGQPVSCGDIVNTGQNHTIVISGISPTLDGEALEPGAFIIVTYEIDGVQTCGGYTQWVGANTAITAYGDDSSTPEKDGFNTGEVFRYRLELPDGTIIGNDNISVEYATGGIFSHTDAYATNGISGLSSFAATTPPVFDCPGLQANIGDPCDDGDPCTENDTIQSDCTCAGTVVPCPDTIAIVNFVLDTFCSQYSLQFTIRGGSGRYLVNEELIADSLFNSTLLDCGVGYSFLVTDDEHTDTVVVSGEGPDCPPPLEVSDLSTDISAAQYTVGFTVQGGTGYYSIDDIPLYGNQFASGLINCGQPYSFKLKDGCDSLIISGDPPCSPCPAMVGDFSRLDTLCNGDLPSLPSDEEILATVDFPENARINWSNDPAQPLTYSGNDLEPQIFEFSLELSCTLDPTSKISGGAVRFQVNPPVKPVIVGYEDTILCKGDTLALSTSYPSDQFQWSTGEETDTLLVFQSDSVWLTVLDTFECWSLPSDTISLVFHDLPDQPVVTKLGQDSLRCNTEAIHYVWQKNGALLPDSTQSISVLESGTYAVQIYNEYCPSPFSEGVEVIVSAEILDFGDQLLLYPNPTSGTLTVEMTLPSAREVYLVIYASSGEKMYSGKFLVAALNIREEIELRSFPAGIYFVQIRVGDKWYTSKLLVQ